MKKIAHKNDKGNIYLLLASFMLIVAVASSCKKEGKELSSTVQEVYSEGDALKIFDPGKKHFTINIDGDIREYYVHIPTGYDGTTAFPVVFMLHGSGGNGLKFYNISGWVEEGEKENIITVFPSSWKYDCVVDDGIEKYNAEKWNSYDLVVCDNNKKRNDVKFLSSIIEKLKQKYAINSNRIYMVGFSNGGEMAARCAVELSNKLAAVVSCAGALPPNFNASPQRLLPVFLQMGSADQKLMAKGGSPTPFPMDIALVISTYPAIQNVINAYTNCFALQPTYTGPVGNANKYLMVTYFGISGTPENIFSFVEVKDLEHQYPNGKNHPLKGAEVHWNWMKDFTLN